MRVVIIGGFAPSLLVFRGPLLEAMVARGHEVVAMAADGTPQIVARLAAMGVRYEELALERAGTDPLSDVRALASLARRLRALRPDLVFSYTVKPVLYGQVAARVARVPRRYAMVTGLGYAFMGQEKRRRRALARMVAGAYRVALSGTHTLFVQNPDDLADLGGAGALPRSLRTFMVRGSGVDVDHYAPAPLPDGPLRFLFVGRILKEKGIEDYVEMARRIRADHPDVRFQVLGGLDPNPASMSREALDRWVADGAFEYLGEVSDVRPVLADNHVLVLPSYREGTPRSVLEAMSMGRPAIITDVPGCRETLVHGEQGLLVPVRDPDGLVAAARRLLADPSEVSAMGARARDRILELYDARRVAAQMLDEMGL